MKLTRRDLLAAGPVAASAAGRAKAPQGRSTLFTLARKSVVFEEAYPEVLPTLPARRCLYTGRRIFPSDLYLQRDDQVKIRGWHPLYTEDVTMSETLKGAGFTTALISDIYHQFKPDKNFHRGFDSWRWIRGHEADRLETGPKRAIPIANLEDD